MDVWDHPSHWNPVSGPGQALGDSLPWGIISLLHVCTYCDCWQTWEQSHPEKSNTSIPRKSHSQVNGAGTAQPLPNWLRDHKWGMSSPQVPTQRRGRRWIKPRMLPKTLVCLSFSFQEAPHLLGPSWEVLSPFFFSSHSPLHFDNETSFSTIDSQLFTSILSLGKNPQHFVGNNVHMQRY